MSRELKPVLYYYIRRKWYNQVAEACDTRKGREPVTLFWHAFALGMLGKFQDCFQELDSFNARKDLHLPVFIATQYFKKREVNVDKEAVKALRNEISMAEDIAKEAGILLAARFHLITGNYSDCRKYVRKILDNSRSADSNASTVFELECQVIEQWCTLEENLAAGINGPELRRVLNGILEQKHKINIEQDPDALMLLARVKQLQGQNYEAVAFLNMAISRFPNFLPALVDKALLLASTNSSSNSSASSGTGTVANIATVGGIAGIGAGNNFLIDWDQALDCAQRILDIDPDHLDALTIIAVHAFTAIPQVHQDKQQGGLTPQEIIEKLQDVDEAIKKKECSIAPNLFVSLQTAMLFSKICARQPRAIQICVRMLEKQALPALTMSNAKPSEEAYVLACLGELKLLQAMIAPSSAATSGSSTSTASASAASSANTANALMDKARDILQEALVRDPHGNLKAQLANIYYHLVDHNLEEAESSMEVISLMFEESQAGGVGATVSDLMTARYIAYLRALIALPKAATGGQGNAADGSAADDLQKHLFHCQQLYLQSLASFFDPDIITATASGSSSSFLEVRYLDAFQHLIVSDPDFCLKVAILSFSQVESTTMMATTFIPSSAAAAGGNGGSSNNAGAAFGIGSGEGAAGGMMAAGNAGGGGAGTVGGGMQTSSNSNILLYSVGPYLLSDTSSSPTAATGGSATSANGKQQQQANASQLYLQHGLELITCLHQLCPGYLPAYVEESRVLYTVQRYDDSLRVLDIAQKLQPQNAPIYLAMALVEAAKYGSSLTSATGSLGGGGGGGGGGLVGIGMAGKGGESAAAAAAANTGSAAAASAASASANTSGRLVEQALSADFSIRGTARYHLIRGIFLGQQGKVSEALKELEALLALPEFNYSYISHGGGAGGAASGGNSSNAALATGGGRAVGMVSYGGGSNSHQHQPAAANVPAINSLEMNYADMMRLTTEDRVLAYIIYACLLSKERRFKEAHKVLSHAKIEFAGQHQGSSGGGSGSASSSATAEVQILVASAMLYCDRGDYDSAIRALDKVGGGGSAGGGGKGSGSSHTAYALAQRVKADILLQHNHDKEGYITCFQHLVDTALTSEHMTLLAEAYLRILNPDAAITIFQRAYQLDPSNRRLRARIGHTLVCTHEYHRALDFYEAAVRQIFNPKAVGAVGAGGGGPGSGPDNKRSSSTSSASSVSSLASEDVQLILDVAALYLRLQRHESALRVLQDTLGGNGNQQGNNSSQQGSSSRLQDRDRLRLFVALARISELSGDVENHQEYLKAACSLQKECMSSHQIAYIQTHANRLQMDRSLLSILYTLLGDAYLQDLYEDTGDVLSSAEFAYSEALAAINHNMMLLTMHSGSGSHPQLGLARLQYRRRQYEACQVSCQKLLVYHPTMREAVLLLADTLLLLQGDAVSSGDGSGVAGVASSTGGAEAAYAPIAAYLQLMPADYLALERAITLLRRAGRLSEAVVLLKQCEVADRRHLTSAGYYYCQGLYARYTNEIGKAISLFNHARRDTGGSNQAAGQAVAASAAAATTGKAASSKAAAAAAANSSHVNVGWAAPALVHMIELYLNPDQEGIWEERDSSMGSPSNNNGSGNAAVDDTTRQHIAAAEELLRELKPLVQQALHGVIVIGGGVGAAAAAGGGGAAGGAGGGSGGGGGAGASGMVIDEMRVKVLESYAQLATRTKVNVDKAMQCFAELLEVNQEYLPAVLGMATGFMIEKNQHKARNLLKRVGKMEVSRHDGEDFEKANLLLAKFYLDKGKSEEAQEVCRKALVQNKSCSQAWELLGLIFEKEDHYDLAADAYQKAWKLEFEASASVGFKLAFSLMKCKRLVETVDVCEMVLRQYPDYPRMKEEILMKALGAMRSNAPMA